MDIYSVYIILPFIYYWVFVGMCVPEYLKKKLFLITFFFQVFIYLAFFEYGRLPDVPFYNRWYKFMCNHSLFDFYSFYHSVHVEYGYSVLVKFLTFFSDNPRLLYIVRSAIFTTCVTYVIFKHSSNYFITVMLFFLTFGLGQSVFVVRQYLALSIYLLSIDSILNKNLRSYLIISFLSLSLHNSIICLIPLYFIYHNIPIERWGIYRIMTFAGLAILCAHSIIRIVSANTGLYDDYLLSESIKGLGSIGLVIRSLVLFVPFYVLCRNDIYTDIYARIYFYICILNILFAFIGFGIPAGSRVFTNYNSFSILIFPYMAYKIKDKNLRFFFLVGIVALFVGLYLVQPKQSSVYTYNFIDFFN